MALSGRERRADLTRRLQARREGGSSGTSRDAELQAGVAARREAGTLNENVLDTSPVGGGSGSDDPNATLGNQLPDVPGVDDPAFGVLDDEGNPQSEQTVGTAVGNTIRDDVERKLEAEKLDKADSEDFAETVQGQNAKSDELFDEALDTLGEGQEDFRDNLQTTRDNLDDIPGKVAEEIDRLDTELNKSIQSSFGRVEQREADALAKTEEGKAAALQAAVQGIQGNVSSAIQQIKANPNLSAAQKASMIAQTRLQGASAMAPAVGATVLAFNQLSADVATKFGTIIGNLEQTGVQVAGAFAQTSATVFAQTQTAVGEMSNQLLGIQANAEIGFANSQSTLIAERASAEMVGNDILLRNAAEFRTPFAQFAEGAIADWQISSELTGTAINRMLNDFAIETSVAALQINQGTVQEGIIIRGLTAFFNGDLPGFILNLLGGFASDASPDRRV